jgi:hypothetical protein
MDIPLVAITILVFSVQQVKVPPMLFQTTAGIYPMLRRFSRNSAMFRSLNITAQGAARSEGLGELSPQF